jgi:hypothetical protein
MPLFSKNRGQESKVTHIVFQFSKSHLPLRLCIMSPRLILSRLTTKGSGGALYQVMGCQILKPCKGFLH